MNELCTLQYTGTTKLSPNLNYIRCSAPFHTKFVHTDIKRGDVNPCVSALPD